MVLGINSRPPELLGYAVQVEVKRAGGVFYIRFEDGSKAYVATELEGGVLKVLETYVPEKHRGRGYARLLIERAIEYARENGLKVLPICSYAVRYFMNNRELRSVLVDELRNLPDGEWEALYKRRLDEEASKPRE